MYNKLFTKILDSSIWLEPMPTRIVWITLLASMDEDGYAHFSAIENLANRARVTIKECNAAVSALTAPDPNSSDPDNDGRRVERVPGGFMLLNAPKYREIVNKFSEKASVASIRRKHLERSTGEVDKGREGYVYFLQKVVGGNIKIGFSSNPWARLNELKTACDEDLVILKAIRSNFADELKWHAKYRDSVVKGEWYLPTQQLLEEIASLSGEPTINGVRSVATLQRSQLRHASASASESASESEREKGSGEKGEPEPPPDPFGPAKEVLQFLNSSTHRSFRETEEHLRIIRARLGEKGVTLDGIKTMISRMCAKWKGTEFEEYLQPSTLFGPKKFGERYDNRELPITLEKNANRHPNRNDPTQNHRNFGFAGDADERARKLAAKVAEQNAQRPPN